MMRVKLSLDELTQHNCFFFQFVLGIGTQIVSKRLKCVNEKYWDSPQIPVLIACIALTATLLILSIHLINNTPNLPFTLQSPASGSGVIVSGFNNSQQAQNLEIGDLITEIKTSNNYWLRLSNDVLVEDPYSLPTFRRFNQFVNQHTMIWQTLQQENVSFRLDSGAEVSVPINYKSGLKHLSWLYWLLYLEAVVALVIGLSVWQARPRAIETSLFALCGIGYYLKIISIATLSSRGFSLDPTGIIFLSNISHFGGSILFASITSLFWVYPKRLAKTQYVLWYFSISFLLLLNRLYQWFPLPFHDFYGAILLGVLIPIIGAWKQWLYTARSPASRTLLRWLLTCTFVSFFAAISTWYLPHIFKGYSDLPYSVSISIWLLAYFGISLGIVRYHIYELSKWWYNIWMLFFTGIFIWASNLALVIAFNLPYKWALLGSILFAGWIYFPLREYMMHRFVIHRENIFEKYLPWLLGRIFDIEKTQDIETAFIDVMERTFRPISVETIDSPRVNSDIRELGTKLYVPFPAGNKTIILTYRNYGQRIYGKNHKRLADSILRGFRVHTEILSSRVSNARHERHRIVRDLHDDVAAQLLSLIHNSHDAERTDQLARSALKSLRDTIYALDDNDNKRLLELFGNLHDECQQRMQDANKQLVWHQELESDHIPLTGRETINISRITTEAISNCLNHGSNTRIEVNVLQRRDELFMSFCNSSNIDPETMIIKGKGLNHIQTRTKELSGNVDWNINRSDLGGTFTLSIKVKLQSITCDENHITS